MGGTKKYLLATRPQFFPGVIIPVGLGAATAWAKINSFNLFYFVLTLAAAVLYHAGMNVLNDYFDHLNNADNINKTPLTPFTGGSRFIQMGEITPAATRIFGAALLTIGSIIGLYLAVTVSPALILIGGAGLFFGLFYSAPPLFFAGRGLGEAVVGLNFGVLTVLGSYVVQTGGFAPEPIFASLPLSFLISALLYINEFPDYEADRLAGKRNLVVRVGPRKGRAGFGLLVAGAYLSIIIGVALGFLPRLSLVALISAIFASAACVGLFKNYSSGARLVPAIKSIILAHTFAGLLLIFAQIF